MLIFLNFITNAAEAQMLPNYVKEADDFPSAGEARLLFAFLVFEYSFLVIFTVELALNM